MDHERGTKISRLVGGACNLAAGAGLAGGLALLLAHAHRGFEITDRAYYLLWARQPELVVGSTTHFGFLTQGLLALVGDDFARFRVLGLLLLAAFSLVLARAMQTYLQRTADGAGPFFSPLALTAVAGALFHYHPWLHEPSYNWLALVAALAAVTALLKLAGDGAAGNPARPARAFAGGVLLLAGGLAAAWTAKPTTAVALAGLSAGWLLWHHPNRRGLGLLGAALLGAGGWLLLFGWYFFGSPLNYAENLRWGLELGTVLGGGHTPGQTLGRTAAQLGAFAGGWLQSPFAWAVAALVALNCWRARRPGAPAGPWPWLEAGPPLLALAAFAHLAWQWQSGTAGLFPGTVLLSALGLLLLAGGGQAWTSRRTAGLVLALLLALAALAPAFGTISDIVRRVSEYAVFPALAMVVLLRQLGPPLVRRLAPPVFTLGMVVLLALTLLKAYERPYRLPGGIEAQQIEIEMGGGRLAVDEKTAAYVQQLRSVAREAGWRPGTPLLDLTGGSPGAVLILEGQIVGVPWLLGNYPGSDRFASLVLTSVEQQLLSRAWLLTAPQGRRRLDPALLADFGRHFPEDYREAGRAVSGHRREEQILWQPKQ